MTIRRYATLSLELLAVVLVVSLVAGQVLGQPILLSYVTTGSMEPTIDTGDGFVAIPSPMMDEVEEGDVVVFNAEELHGGGLTTHRVVGETDRGFTTRGDANPFTDQDGDEPPVKRAQIVAEAWQVGGTVVVIPELGTAVMGIQGAIEDTQRVLAATTGMRSFLGSGGLAYLLFALSAGAYLVEVLNSRGEKERERDRSRDDGQDARLLLVVFTLVIVLAATAAMVMPAGQQKFGVVSADSDSPGPRVIEKGTTENLTYMLPNSGLVPVFVVLEPASDGVAVEPREATVGARSNVNATISLSAPPENGYYRRFVVEHRYLGVLPTGVLRGLHGIHPWVAIGTIDLLLGVPFYLVGRLAVGTGRVRTRSREGGRGGGIVGRLQRMLD